MLKQQAKLSRHLWLEPTAENFDFLWVLDELST